MSDKELAINIILEDAEIHRGWLKWNVDHEEHINNCSECKIVQKTAGDAEWHREWISKYEVVYKALKGEA